MNYQLINSIVVNLASLASANVPEGLKTNRKKRVSDSFVTRVANDGSQETDMIIEQIKEYIRVVNKANKDVLGNYRLRLIKRGRKPVAGVKYSWGGSLKLENAREIDLYIGKVN